MKRSGRVSPLIVIGVLCFLIIVPLMCASSRGPEYTAAEFMAALGKGDVDKLMKTSVIGSADPSRTRELWAKTLERGKYYLFTWRVVNSVQNTPDTAVVELQIRRNLQLKMGSEEERFQLPLIKDKDGWKVDVQSANRGMYPGLPRA